MTDDAGFAAAVTVREHVLNVALLTAYANGTFPERLETPIPDGPPDITSHLVLGQPEIKCEGATNRLVVTLPVWGPLTVKVDSQTINVDIVGELEVTFPPAFAPGTSLRLDPEPAAVVVRRWTASVTSPAAPPDVVAYLVGDPFKDRLQTTIRAGIAFQRIKLPSVDVSFFGPLARKATSVDGRVRNGVLLLGLNVEDDTVPISIVGDANALTDFARSNDVAGVVNAVATDLLLDDLHTRMVTAVEDDGAELDRFSVTPEAGYFSVTGAASKSEGTVNFSFRVVPRMYHTRPGAVFQYLPKTRFVHSRTWAALDFRIEDVETDVDRSWWVIVLEVVLGVLTVGLATLAIEDMVSAAGQNFSAQVEAAKPGAPAARVRRTIPPAGGVAVRIGIDEFEITGDGTYIGISIREKPTAAALLGPTLVPSTYEGDTLRYLMRLPSGVRSTDPALRIRWFLEDRTNGVFIADDDGPAAGRLRFDFSPGAFGGVTNFGIVARLYRQLGPNVTELGTESLNLSIRGPLPPNAYIRWRSGAKTPQISVDEATDEWSYNGEVQVLRWSEWHRTDLPCRAVNTFSHRFDEQRADRLPFSLHLLENHRKGLCPYCFYGGPAGLNPAL